MTVWLVADKVNANALKAFYISLDVRGRDNPGIPEEAGGFTVDRSGQKILTGTTRISAETFIELQRTKPFWLEVHESFPDDWENALPPRPVQL